MMREVLRALYEAGQTEIECIGFYKGGQYGKTWGGIFTGLLDFRTKEYLTDHVCQMNYGGKGNTFVLFEGKIYKYQRANWSYDYSIDKIFKYAEIYVYYFDGSAVFLLETDNCWVCTNSKDILNKHFIDAPSSMDGLKNKYDENIFTVCIYDNIIYYPYFNTLQVISTKYKIIDETDDYYILEYKEKNSIIKAYKNFEAALDEALIHRAKNI